MVAAAGAVDEDELLALAERDFGAGDRAGPAKRRAPRAFAGGARAAVEAAGAGATCVFLLPAVGARDRTISPCACIAEMLGGGAWPRACSRKRASSGLAYAVDAYSETYADTGVAGRLRRLRGQGRAWNWPRWRPARSRAWPQKIEAAELSRAKAQLKALDVHGPGAAPVARRAGRRPGAAVRPHLPPAELAEQIDAVTQADLDRPGRADPGPAPVAPSAVLGWPKAARFRKAADAFQARCFAWAFAACWAVSARLDARPIPSTFRSWPCWIGSPRRAGCGSRATGFACGLRAPRTSPSGGELRSQSRDFL